MLKLNQHVTGWSSRYDNILNDNHFELSVDRGLIDKDINRLKEALNHKLNKMNRENINNLIKYLNNIRREVYDGKLELCWKKKDNYITTYKIELKNIRDYNINTCDYIELNDEKLYMLDYKEISDLIALEMMYMDLGFSFEEMEELLDKQGISGANSTEVFEKLFSDIESHGTRLNPFYFSKDAKVDRSPYIISDKRYIKDYFGLSLYKIDNKNKDCGYRKVVEDSAKIAMSLIAEYIVENGKEYKLDLKLVAVSNKDIAFIIKGNPTFNINKLIENVTLRVFGRMFSIIPNVTVL